MRQQKGPFEYFCEISAQLLAGNLQNLSSWRIIYLLTEDDAELKAKIDAHLGALQGQDPIFDSLVQFFIAKNPEQAREIVDAVLAQETQKIRETEVIAENIKALLSSYLDGGRPEKRAALTIFGNHLKRLRGSLSAYSNASFLRGWIYQNYERNFDKATEFYLAAGTPDQKNANALYALALIYEDRSTYAAQEEVESFAEQAQIFFTTVIEELRYPEAMNSYGMTLDDTDPRKEQLIRKASEHGHLYAHYNLAVLLRRKDPDSEEAKRLLTIAERFGMRQELWNQALLFFQRANNFQDSNPPLAELLNRRALDRLRGMICLNPLKGLQALAKLSLEKVRQLQLEKRPGQALYYADLLLSDSASAYARNLINELFDTGPEINLGQRYFELVWPEIEANTWKPTELVIIKLAQRMEDSPGHSSPPNNLKTIIARKISAIASPRLQRELISRILNKEPSGLTSFFWTQRSLTEPSVEAGSLKILSEQLAHLGEDKGIELGALPERPGAPEAPVEDSQNLGRAKQAFYEGNYGAALFFYESAIHADPGQINTELCQQITEKIVLAQGLSELGDQGAQFGSYIDLALRAMLTNTWQPLDNTVCLLANEKELLLDKIWLSDESKRCKLLSAAINPNTPLGRVFWYQRGSSPCSLGSGQLAVIQKELDRIQTSRQSSSGDVELRLLRSPGAR